MNQSALCGTLWLRIFEGHTFLEKKSVYMYLCIYAYIHAYMKILSRITLEDKYFKVYDRHTYMCTVCSPMFHSVLHGNSDLQRRSCWLRGSNKFI
jgi:hypothetical protein